MKEKYLQKGSKGRIVLWILLVAALIAAIACLTLFVLNHFSVVISIYGNTDLSLEYGSAYTDAGADAKLVGTWFCKDGYPLEISAEGSVDPDVVGSYEITYKSSFLWFHNTAHRKVKIVDTQAPVIELITKEGTYTIPGEVYIDEGFTARDDYDGDLTNRVIRYANDEFVVYQVKDSSGNVTKVQRQIRYYDPVAPELTLEGPDEISISVGSMYEEPGFKAADNCEGDMTSKVVVSGNIDVQSPGTYVLKYEVADSYGNKATAERKVNVTGIHLPDTAVGGVVYLTFDDGPSAHTGRLLDVLNKYGIKATFFVVDTGYYDMMRRIVNEGHAIGLHTATHKYGSVYASEEAYFNDLQTIKNIVLEQTGAQTTLIRFPGGSSNTVSSFNPGIMTRLTKAVTERGYQYFDWNVSSGDAGETYTTQGVVQNVINGVSNNDYSIVLQHDICGYSVDAVEQIIQWGLANGYTFAALDPACSGCHHRINN